MTRFPVLLLLPLLTLFFWLLLSPPRPSSRRPPLASLAPREALACTGWQQVSQGGFGLPTVFDENGSPLPVGSQPQPFRGEEGFETLVFDGRLYVGMEADNRLGARLWRTGAGAPQGQADWEEVIADENGLPWGIAPVRQVDHIDSLAEFRGYLYASSANSGDPLGTRIFRSPSGDPGSWQDALRLQGPGFGDPANENFKDMQAFDGWLCGGTWNETSGAQVWCTRDGLQWEQKNEPGFGDARTAIIWSAEVFGGALYVGAQHFGEDPQALGDDTARVYRTRSLAGTPIWEPVYTGEPPSLGAILLGEMDGRLYIAHPSPQGIRILSSADGRAGSWKPAGLAGLDGARWNFQTVTDGAVRYRGLLHVAVINARSGLRVWRTNGNGFWEPVGAPREIPASRFAAQLAVFEDQLYAWASDYDGGQAVLRTSCDFQAADTTVGLLIAALLGMLSAVLGGKWIANRRSKSGYSIIATCRQF